MIVGTFLFHGIFLYMVVLAPLCKLQLAFTESNITLVQKWCSFLLCVVTFVIPLLYIPSYIPLRNDIIVIILTVMSMFDATVSHFLIQRYIIPVMKQLQMVFVAVQVTLAGATTRPVSAPGYQDSSDSERDEKCEGEGDGKES